MEKDNILDNMILSLKINILKFPTGLKCNINILFLNITI